MSSVSRTETVRGRIAPAVVGREVHYPRPEALSADPFAAAPAEERKDDLSRTQWGVFGERK